jgi:hypothetical protein
MIEHERRISNSLGIELGAVPKAQSSCKDLASPGNDYLVKILLSVVAKLLVEVAACIRQWRCPMCC